MYEKFFGTTCHPVLELNDLILTEVAQKTVMEGYTVPRVQKRLSLHLFEEKEGMKLTIVDYPAGYILKPQTQEFSHLPELEQLGMCLAQIAKIDTVLLRSFDWMMDSLRTSQNGSIESKEKKRSIK